MGFKKMKNEFSFADLVLENSKKNNRSIKKMQNLKKSINWNRVEDILVSHYTVGTSNEGADAYPPLLPLMTQPICHIAPPTAGIQNSQS
ncbi:MAG: hypothetical protein QME06_09220 [Desulfobacterales bacterium]|nr:hypothetical protein [Desulfobacterales bacterium]